jgi:gas vesicle protein
LIRLYALESTSGVVTGRRPSTRDAKAYLAAEETRNPNIPFGESHPLVVGGGQKEFAQYLREDLEGDEWRLPTSDISADTWSRDIDVADETPSQKDVDITAVDLEEMSFAVERALCEQHDISIHQSVDDRREELKEARQAVQSETTDTEESQTDTGGFEFPAASQ